MFLSECSRPISISLVLKPETHHDCDHMSTSATFIGTLLDRARTGDAAAVGELLEAHRPLLKFLAMRYLDGPLGARLDASDLVQQTCLSVWGRIAQFDGHDPAAFV